MFVAMDGRQQPPTLLVRPLTSNRSFDQQHVPRFLDQKFDGCPRSEQFPSWMGDLLKLSVFFVRSPNLQAAPGGQISYRNVKEYSSLVQLCH